MAENRLIKRETDNARGDENSRVYRRVPLQLSFSEPSLTTLGADFF